MRAWLWPAVRTDQRGISFSSAQLPGIERWGPATVLASGTSRQETGTRNTGASGTFLGVKAGTPGGPRALPRLLLAQCVCGQPGWRKTRSRVPFHACYCGAEHREHTISYRIKFSMLSTQVISF
ncbi:PREDICTED: uncharacterized protein LOC108533427 isoform X1 [Rhinopithecus bieti]|uniref:uncharacterized protein LOC108533427 isoform X1 n=1 Tax=Rhinopithecus bieti TaxID=61621 RepID=UPI00083C7DD8|nr:PREDICTED: uncharacterized protein LOC108533427 isoform X1 [Rhinopithecus bieti]